tara:strand:- start:233 stop:1006 length:774 start_codon:yes stop_codon:yes gene_type:complete
MVRIFYYKITIALLVLFIPTMPLGAAEVTFDIGNYKYEEEVDGAFFMSDESDPLFFSVGIRDWDRPPKDSLKVLYTAELTYGQVEYNGSGTMTKDYYKARFEGLLAYDIAGFSPFIGIGYRQLYDDSGGTVTSTGALGYDRRSQYLYMPVGIIADIGDDLSFKGQYNLFLGGKQTSYLSSAISVCNDVDNTQDDGYGFDAALNYKMSEKFTLFGYYRFWDIEDSRSANIVCAGSVVAAGLEPKNTTTEIGVGVSLRF